MLMKTMASRHTITFIAKKDHEEKWELGQHFLEVNNGKR
jgi:hypothetical protein